MMTVAAKRSMDDFGRIAAELDEKLPLKVLVPVGESVRDQTVSLGYLIQYVTHVFHYDL